MAQYDTCGARKKNGDPCGRPAGWGTPNKTGSCKLHGGATPNARKHAQRLEAEQAVTTYGLPREIDPHTALLEELHRTAGHVAWLGRKVADLEDDQLHGPVGGSQFGFPKEEPHVWVRLYQEERAHFARIAKTCHDVGIEERRVHLAEQQGELMAQVIDGILNDLGVRDRPEVPGVVRRHLTLVAEDRTAA